MFGRNFAFHYRQKCLWYDTFSASSSAFSLKLGQLANCLRLRAPAAMSASLRWNHTRCFWDCIERNMIRRVCSPKPQCEPTCSLFNSILICIRRAMVEVPPYSISYIWLWLSKANPKLIMRQNYQTKPFSKYGVQWLRNEKGLSGVQRSGDTEFDSRIYCKL